MRLRDYLKSEDAHFIESLFCVVTECIEIVIKTFV